MFIKILKIKNTSKRRLLQIVGLLMTVGIMLTGGMGTVVRADQYDQQIQQLQTKNAQTRNNVSDLQAQASSYQDAINKLQSQIDSIQTELQTNQTQEAQLQQQIQDNETKLAQQKVVLGDDIRTMYVNGQMTTIEELATSKNLSDFVDAEEYRNSVANKIQATLKTITTLQQQLQKQKTTVDQLVQTEQAQQNQLASDQQQQNTLLAMNESQQTAYNQQLQTNNSQIAQLRAAQIAANASNSVSTLASGGACDAADGDTYPASLCGVAQDSVTDPWGLLNRECVSYTAWKEAEQGRYVPYGLGNAGDWPANARAHGIRVDTNPEVGSVAIRPAFSDVYFGSEQDVGHSMYVEATNVGGDPNKIIVSEYNADLNGRYKREIKYISGTYHGHYYQLQFIHFR